MSYLRVWIIVYELGSYCLHAGLEMSTYKLSRQLENVYSDEKFLEECTRQKLVPKSLHKKRAKKGGGSGLEGDMK